MISLPGHASKPSRCRSAADRWPVGLARGTTGIRSDHRRASTGSDCSSCRQPSACRSTAASNSTPRRSPTASPQPCCCSTPSPSPASADCRPPTLATPATTWPSRSTPTPCPVPPPNRPAATPTPRRPAERADSGQSDFAVAVPRPAGLPTTHRRPDEPPTPQSGHTATASPQQRTTPTRPRHATRCRSQNFGLQPDHRRTPRRTSRSLFQQLHHRTQPHPERTVTREVPRHTLLHRPRCVHARRTGRAGCALAAPLVSAGHDRRRQLSELANARRPTRAEGPCSGAQPWFLPRHRPEMLVRPRGAGRRLRRRSAGSRQGERCLTPTGLRPAFADRSS